MINHKKFLNLSIICTLVMWNKYLHILSQLAADFKIRKMKNLWTLLLHVVMLMHLNIVERYKKKIIKNKKMVYYEDWKWVFIWHAKLLIEIWKNSPLLWQFFFVYNLEKCFPYFLKIIFNNRFYTGDFYWCLLLWNNNPL